MKRIFLALLVLTLILPTIAFVEFVATAPSVRWVTSTPSRAMEHQAILVTVGRPLKPNSTSRAVSQWTPQATY